METPGHWFCNHAVAEWIVSRALWVSRGRNIHSHQGHVGKFKWHNSSPTAHSSMSRQAVGSVMETWAGLHQPLTGTASLLSDDLRESLSLCDDCRGPLLALLLWWSFLYFMLVGEENWSHSAMWDFLRSNIWHWRGFCRFLILDFSYRFHWISMMFGKFSPKTSAKLLSCGWRVCLWWYVQFQSITIGPEHPKFEMLDESPGLEVSDPFMPVTCAQGEPALICGKDGAPLLDLSGTRAGSEHRAHVWLLVRDGHTRGSLKVIL